MMSRDELHKEKGSNLIIAIINFELYVELGKRYGFEIAKEKLKELGTNIANTYYEYFKPSETSISGLSRTILDVVAGVKKLRLKKVEDGFNTAIFNCPLCLPEIELEGPSLCISIMAILEGMLNLIFHDKPQKFRYKQAIGEVLKSRSRGDEICEYHYRLIQR